MVNEKILYERAHVIVKERWAPNEPRTGLAEEINGTITILDNGSRKCFRFLPFGLEDSMNEDWALINGSHSVVSYKNSEKDSASIQSNPLLKFRFFFNLNELQSVRRYHMLQGIGHMAFALKDGRPLPTFYFNLGGSKELLNVLCQHLPLQKSTHDNRIYVLKEEPVPETNGRAVSAFDQMNLFDNPNEMISRFRGPDFRRRPIERFSRVTNFLKDAFLGQNEMISTADHPDGTIGPDITAMMESFSKDLRESNNDGFEVIYKVDFKQLPEVTRSPPLTAKDWEMSFDNNGRLLDVSRMKERIFRGGLESNALRREVWKFLLNHFPWSSTRDERLDLAKQRELEYFAMKLQWRSMNEQQKQKNSLFRDRESLIEKDVTRTDRTHEYFQGDNNVHLEVLHDVLMTYNMFNFDLGYVQGMNDLLSPILIVMENEVDAFWCFAGLMGRMEQNFHMDQSHIKRQLSNLHTLLQFIDAELANYLVENNSSNMYFFFRWMLICFKREFSFDDVMHLWEVLWTDHLCQNFELLVCLAILISQKTVIMESKFGCNEILKHINDLSLKVPLEPLLKHAEGLYILLQQYDQSTPGLPQSISTIMFPRRGKKSTRAEGHESDSDAGSTISSVKSSRGASPHPDEPSAPERQARTRHLTESHSIDENDSAVISHAGGTRMSKNKLKDSDDDDDDEEDDDYCPTANDHDASESSAEEENHPTEDGKKSDTDLNVKPYDESKTNELWESLTSNSTSTAAAKPVVVESPKPAPVTTKIFEFAGEKISVPVPSLKRPAGGSSSSSSSSSVLDRLGIGKKQKLSTLEKSRLDWQSHKDSEALTDDLESHRRGKDSYVEKKAFLQRSETREHDHYLNHLKKK